MEGLTDDSRARKMPSPRRVRTSSVVLKVLSWRRQAPWGKQLLTELLRREGIAIGETSVGKICTNCWKAAKSLVAGSANSIGRQRILRARGKAVVEWLGYLPMDYMKVVVERGYSVVMFVARDRFSNALYAMAATHATVATATRFLQAV